MKIKKIGPVRKIEAEIGVRIECPRCGRRLFASLAKFVKGKVECPCGAKLQWKKK